MRVYVNEHWSNETHSGDCVIILKSWLRRA